jgi:subtilisin-like proprotein convertase family protein
LEDRRLLAVLTVNTTSDTTVAGDGLVTLREAIIAANTDAATDGGGTGSGADTIQFAAGLSGATINLSSTGELKITSAMSIDASSLANGLTVKAFDVSPVIGNGTRIFNIDDANAAAINVSINGLTLTGGDIDGAGGAILSHENLTMVRSIVTGNRATLDGGGINSDTGQLYLSGSTVSNNNGRDGGGVYQKNGGLIVSTSTISGNQGRVGGGVNATTTTATFDRSTISGNTGFTGGGIVSAQSTTTILNSTVSGNSATNLGGGMWANVIVGNPLMILNSTITRNTSNSDISGGGSGGGIYFGPGTGAVTMRNSIIAGNTDFSNIAPDIDNISPPTHPTIAANFNLIGINKGSGIGAGNPDGNGNRVGTAAAPINPLLGPLTNNGGVTKTHSLLGGSLAIDNGDPAFVPGGGPNQPTTDQRGSGFPRVTNGRLDIGAFELTPPLTQSTMALLASSDTGMFNDDHVTSINKPAFGGVGPAGRPVYVFAQRTDAAGDPSGAPFIIGQSTVGVDGTAGTVNDDFGAWEVTVEPLADGKYLFFSRFDFPVDGTGGLQGAVGDLPVTLTPVDVPKAIPMGPNGVATSTITVGGGGGGAGASVEEKFVASLTVTVNVTYPDVGDLTLFLVGPNGTNVLLSNQRGGAGNNFTNTVFDDNAATSITTIVAGGAPFTGTFRPEGSLADFMGDPVNGPWTLVVVNNVPGNTGTIVNWSLAIESPIAVVIDTVAPNTPFLDLLFDAGRNNSDNITRRNQISVSMTSEDPNIRFAELLFTDNLKFRIYDRYVSTAGNGSPEFLIYDSAQDPDADAISNALDMFTSETQLTKQLPFLLPVTTAITSDGKLADGIHDLKLVVEDRAGNISHDFQLHITVDTSIPPVSFGLPDAVNATDGLVASSDSGVTTVPATFADRITNVTTPTFWGRAEANSIVRLFYDKNADGKIQTDGPNADIFLGQTTAVPLDGNDAYPNGYWEIRSALDLNQVPNLLKDGLRRMLVTAEDVAGNPVQTPTPGNNDFHEITEVGRLQIFIDTQGPQITAVTPNDTLFNLFDPKPSQTGPTPLVNSLRIAFQDLPARADSNDAINQFLYNALVTGIAQTPGNYLLVGDHVGPIAIQSINVVNSLPNQINATLTGVQSTAVLTASGLIGANPRPEVGDYILVTSGAGNGQVRRITTYDPTTGAMGLDIPLITVPAAGDTIKITKIAYASVFLNFASPLPDDRYTLTVKDNLVDPAGNRLDGESHAPEPQAPPIFPTGDGVPGGSFSARFTVDSHPEIGSYVSQNINIDINGNGVWDPTTSQIGGDSTHMDISWTLPVKNADGSIGIGGFNVHDLLFAGKFRMQTFTPPDQQAVLAVLGPLFFDQLAAFGNSAEDGGVFRWIIDTNSDGVVTLGTDIKTFQPLLGNFNVAGAIPMAGNFDGVLGNGDEIGLYNSGKWGLDFNRNFVIEANEVISTQLFGRPIVGDFDGDGKDDLAVFNNNVFYFILANDGLNDANDRALVWGFPGVLDQPVAADMDQDGIDDIGLWVPRSSATPPSALSQWYFLVSNDPVGNLRQIGNINRLNHAFTPTPFGFDLYAEFGDDRAMPIVGNFDPPVAHQTSVASGLLGDYDGNGRVEQADYTVWKQNYGSNSNLAADGNRNGVIDIADYAIWRNNMGAVGAGAQSLALIGGQGSTASLGGSEPTNGAGAGSAGSAAGFYVYQANTEFSATESSATSSGTVTVISVPAAGDDSLLLVLDRPTATSVDDALDILGGADDGDEEFAAAVLDDGALAAAWQAWDEL